MAKKLKKRIKKLKKKSPWPARIYRLGLFAKTFFAYLTGVSLIIVAALSASHPISADDIVDLALNTDVGRVFIFLLGLSLLTYQSIELVRKYKKAPKMIKKL